MDFLKRISYPKKTKHYIYFLVVFVLINSLKLLASEYKFHLTRNQKTYDFEKVYFESSIPYAEYDSSSGQLKSFFGLKSDQSLTNYYPDLNIIKSSDSLRAIYRSKLNDMIVDRFFYKLKK